MIRLGCCFVLRITKSTRREKHLIEMGFYDICGPIWGNSNVYRDYESCSIDQLQRPISH